MTKSYSSSEMKPYTSLRKKAASGGTILLDGAMGSELYEHDSSWEKSSLPWSISPLLTSPRKIVDLHSDYIAAGCNVITANSFRTSASALRQFFNSSLLSSVDLKGTDNIRSDFENNMLQFASSISHAWSKNSEPLTALSLFLANMARFHTPMGNEACIALSVTTFYDCYSPQELKNVDFEFLVRAHSEHMKMIATLEDHFDILLVETVNRGIEAAAILESAQNCGIKKPIWVSFVADRELHREGTDEKILLYPSLVDGKIIELGESINSALEALKSADNPYLDAVLFNCSTPEAVGAAIEKIVEISARADSKLLFGGYANAESETPDGAWKRSVTFTHETYAKHCTEWINSGASIIGGCCGIKPRDIRHIANLLDV